MSSTVSVTPLAIEIRPSRRLACYVLSVYTAAGLALITLPCPLWLLGVALLALLLSCVATYSRCVSLRSRVVVLALNRNTAGGWQLRLGDGSLHQASLLPDSYLHSTFLVLNFRFDNGRRRSVVLARDSADETSLRRLRAALALGVRESTD